MAPPLITLNESNKKECQFCGCDEIDQLKYGPMYSQEEVVAHYYCILLSHKMEQNGKDEEGILGFLLKDIRVELKRVSKINCAYCGKGKASLQCSNKKCKIKFHLPCGLRRGSMHQFMKQFLSFCGDHRPEQEVPLKAYQEAENEKPVCLICQEDVDIKKLSDTIWAPCCSKTWYHRICIQQLANSAGYFFKCPSCNNNEKFRSWVLKYGIFIPEQDASWELEPNAYSELLTRYSNCDADECKCPNGRKENAEKTRWEIILCDSCGSQGIHIACGKLKFHNPSWECCMCSKVPGGEATSGNISSASSGSDISVADSINSARSGRPSLRRRRLESRNLDDNSKRGYRIYLPTRRTLRARQLRHRNELTNVTEDESSSDPSDDKKSVNFSRDSSPASLAERPSSSVNSDNARSGELRRRRSWSRTKKRKSRGDENDEFEESAKKSKHSYPTRNRSRTVGDENLRPSSNFKRKDRSQSPSSSTSSSGENSSSNARAIPLVKPGPLSWKMKVFKKAIGAQESSDDDIIQLPTPRKVPEVVDLSDSSPEPEPEPEAEPEPETETETDPEPKPKPTPEPELESEEEITVMNISQQDIMYRVKKEVVEESDEDVIEVAEVADDESSGEVQDVDKTVLSVVYDGSNFKVVEESLKTRIIIVKTEVPEKDEEAEEEVVVEPGPVKEKTPEVEEREKGEAPVSLHVENVTKNKSDAKAKDKVKKIDMVPEEKKKAERVKEDKEATLKKPEITQKTNEETSKIDEEVKKEKGRMPEKPIKDEEKKIIHFAPLMEFEGELYSARDVGQGEIRYVKLEGPELEKSRKLFSDSDQTSKLKPLNAPVSSPVHAPAPATVLEPAPATVLEPAPAAVLEPAPAIVHASAPSTVHASASAIVHAPAPAPVNAPAPAPVNAPAPAPVHVPPTSVYAPPPVQFPVPTHAPDVPLGSSVDLHAVSFSSSVPSNTSSYHSSLPSGPGPSSYPSSIPTLVSGSHVPPRVALDRGGRRPTDFQQHGNYGSHVRNCPPSQYRQNYYSPQKPNSSQYSSASVASSYTRPISAPHTVSSAYSSSPSATSSWSPQRHRFPNNPTHRPSNPDSSNFEVVGMIDPLNSQSVKVPESPMSPPKNPSSGNIPFQNQPPQYSQFTPYSSASHYQSSQQLQYSAPSHRPQYPQQSQSQPQPSQYSQQTTYSGASYYQQPSQYSSATQQQYCPPSQQYFSSSQPQSSYQSSEARTSQQAPFIISEVVSLANKAYEASDADRTIRTPNKAPSQRKSTPPDRNTSGRQTLSSRWPTTPPRPPNPRPKVPYPPHRLQQLNLKPVAAIKPSPPVPASRKPSNEKKEIPIIDLEKPSPPSLQKVQGLARGNPKSPTKKGGFTELIEID